MRDSVAWRGDNASRYLLAPNQTARPRLTRKRVQRHHHGLSLNDVDVHPRRAPIGVPARSAERA